MGDASNGNGILRDLRSKRVDIGAAKERVAGVFAKRQDKKPKPKLPSGIPQSQDATDALLRERSRAEIDQQIQGGKGRYGAGLFGAVVRPKRTGSGSRAFSESAGMGKTYLGNTEAMLRGSGGRASSGLFGSFIKPR